LDLEHYLDVLSKKPGALAGSTPLEQWRAQGRWPTSFDQVATRHLAIITSIPRTGARRTG
jgi:hypothetical protein